MGKGARSREKNAEKRTELQLKQTMEAKKKKRNKWIISIISLVLVVTLGTSGLVYAFYYGNGKYLRDTTAVSTENFKVDNAMMTYFFRNSYESTKASYGGYFEQLSGVNPNKSLKDQKASGGDKSWFDTLLDSTKTAVSQMLVLAESAKADGMELSESDRKLIENNVKALAPTYCKDGVSKEDIQHALEISVLSNKYTNKVKSDLQFSESDIEKQFTENENTYKTAAYRSYTIDYKDETAAEAKEKAAELMAATSEDQFLLLAKELITAGDTTLDDAAVQTKLDATLAAKVSYTADDEVSEWAFDKNRKVGDTKLKETADIKEYTVYFLTSPAVEDKSNTVNIRHILFTVNKYGSDDKAKAQAEEVLKKWQETPTEEAFGNLAAEYSEDGGSNQNGGLYTGVVQGSMMQEFDAWCFDAARKVGDSDIVKTDAGFHIMYYAGAGKEVWQEAAETDLKNNAYEEKLTALKAQHPVTINEEKLTDIPA
ncbi:MAG: peptidylprolyl isomerase [Oscillospiraceae bacterium]